MVYSSATGKTTNESIKFRCINPEGRNCDVEYKGLDDIKVLFGFVLAKLTSITENYPTNYYFDINRW